MEKLRKMYYYPISIVVIAAVGSIGLKVFVFFAMHIHPVANYVLCAGEFIELAYYCALGELVDACVCSFYIIYLIVVLI